MEQINDPNMKDPNLLAELVVWLTTFILPIQLIVGILNQNYWQAVAMTIAIAGFWVIIKNKKEALK